MTNLITSKKYLHDTTYVIGVNTNNLTNNMLQFEMNYRHDSIKLEITGYDFVNYIHSAREEVELAKQMRVALAATGLMHYFEAGTKDHFVLTKTIDMHNIDLKLDKFAENVVALNEVLKGLININQDTLNKHA